MFSISDKVVCVDAKNINRSREFSALPVEGQVYVIRGIDDSITAGIVPGVYLVGIIGSIWWDGSERPFRQRRFRKLTDIQAENALRNAEPSLANVTAQPRAERGEEQ